MKEKEEMKGRGFDPWVRKIPWRRAWQPTPVFLPGESSGQRRLASYSSWGHKESDATEATEHAHMYLATGDTERVKQSVSDLGRNFRWSQ